MPDIDVRMIEDRLPPQKPVATSSVKSFRKIIRVALGAARNAGFSTIVIFYGRAGIGKSMAIQDLVDSLKARAHTGIPAAIDVVVEPQATERRLAELMFHRLGEPPRRGNRWQMLDAVVNAIVDNDIEMLIFDEADRLTERTFDFVRDIHDKCDQRGHPIVMLLVGLRTIINVVKLREKFNSRVGPRFEFEALDQKEFLETLLPQLTIPRWEFDPARPADHALGMLLWTKLRPSVRRVRTALGLASMIAETYGNVTITQEHIDEALAFMQHQTPEASESDDDVDPDDDGGNQPQGPLEQESEQRHANKANRGRRKR